MLTEKDYCDYETCVALKELGYKVPTSAYYMPNNNQLIFVSNPCRGGYVIDCFYSHNSLPKDVMTANYIDVPTIWETQEWLREAHNLHIEITYSPACWTGTIYDLNKWDYIKGFTFFESFEDTLHTLIKEAVKILKEK